MSVQKGNSREVSSSQTGVHERLQEVVQRNLDNPFRKPFADHTLEAFDRAQRWVDKHNRPLIFDSCCGVGESSRHIAQQYPQHAVIALDRSEVRLDKHRRCFDETIENLLFVRADLMDFWRLAQQEGWTLDQHYLLYPNPYPKPGQLQRRWHASPVFSSLLALRGELTVRSNWITYIEEFVRALAVAGYSSQVSPYSAEIPMTAFERKYWASGQRSWQCKVKL